MPFLNAIVFFLLLISSNIGLANISLPVEKDCDENSITFQVSKDVQELFESTLTAPSVLHNSPLVSSEIPDFSFSSCNREQKALLYVAFSQTIVPGLTVTKIIFPFHTFL